MHENGWKVLADDLGLVEAALSLIAAYVKSSCRTVAIKNM